MGIEGAAPEPTSVLAGARLLDHLTPADADALGGEAADLATLREAGVPVARGYVISFDREPHEVASALAHALSRPPPKPRLLGTSAKPVRLGVRLRPWFESASVSHRVGSRWPSTPPIVDPTQITPALETLWAEVGAARRAWLGSSRPGGVWLRALICDEGPTGRACSVDPTSGDPSSVAVWHPDQRPWRMDRKTMRPLEEGHGELPRPIIERAADLADRAQLALGGPVELDWVLSGGRPVVARVRPTNVTWRFTDEAWRVVSLLWHDEGPIAPLAVDGLDKALREETDAVDELRVRRLFARAYRRVEAGRGWRGERRHPFGAAAARVAQVVTDVARPIAAARAFTKTLRERLDAFDSDDLSRFDDLELAKALRERQRVVIEAYELLDRGRKATAAVLSALEAALGTVPRDCVLGLAAIRRPRSRRRLDARLAKLAVELGELPTELDPVPAPQRPVFAELRRELATKRPLGLDVRPEAYGASDRALVDGMVAARDGWAAQAEREQRQAIRRLMATARARPLGRGRAALARTLTMMIERLADAKGTVAEGLADANLRVRDAAVEIGRRLVDRGILDEPDDALYLYVGEIQNALAGEPGAYTARVRLRREEDARWRAFVPPTRLARR
ncbi:MAG TPA: hypothetical protein RMH99_31980 [Sandaracinaceae bacterium LLY-WYZ-13_1]|nr:hypothetical protein [Sandaracinaceae bacterium LLY-WYZ-13_1]